MHMYSIVHVLETAHLLSPSATVVKHEQPVSPASDSVSESLPPPTTCTVQVATTSSATSPLVSSVTVSSEGIKNEEVSMLDHKVCPACTAHF